MTSAGRTIGMVMTWARAAVVIGLVAAVALAARQVGAGAAPCLPAAEGTIVESTTFTPLEDRRGGPRDGPINRLGEPAADVPLQPWVPTGALDGLPLQFAKGYADGSFALFFSARPIDTEVTLPQLWAAGGISFARWPGSEETALSSELLDFLGERAVLVEVGPYRGLLTWADPVGTGVRPHYLTWTDGTYTYRVVADRTAAATVTLVRGMVCS